MQITEEEVTFVDGLDAAWCVDKIEASLGVELPESTYSGVRSVGDVIDAITTNFQAEHQANCTSQQAFYKLRQALVDTGITTKEKVQLRTRLEDLFPRKNR